MTQYVQNQTVILVRTKFFFLDNSNTIIDITKRFVLKTYRNTHA